MRCPPLSASPGRSHGPRSLRPLSVRLGTTRSCRTVSRSSGTPDICGRRRWRGCSIRYVASSWPFCAAPPHPRCGWRDAKPIAPARPSPSGSTMTPQQIALVRMSFAAVRPIADSAAALFYGRLFELDPSLRPLFKSNLHGQGRLLMQMIGLAVDSLDRLDELAPKLTSL